MSQPTLIFDLDGTLVRCREYYNAAIEQFAEYTSQRTGLPQAAMDELVRKMDLLAVQATQSWMRSRWCRSFAAASYAADAMLGEEPNQQAAKHVSDIAEQTFWAPYPLYDRVAETLEIYKVWGWRLMLYTKGDPEVQLRKVQINNLHQWFEPSRVVVTPKKDLLHLQHLCRSFRIQSTGTWMIGDSLRDDIEPAKAVGMRTLHMVTTPWEYDRAEVVPDAVLQCFKDLTTVISPDPATAMREGAVQAA